MKLRQVILTRTYTSLELVACWEALNHASWYIHMLQFSPFRFLSLDLFLRAEERGKNVDAYVCVSTAVFATVLLPKLSRAVQ